MNGLEKSLNKIADTILHLDEASLTSLWDEYKIKWSNFPHCRMGKSVIIFSIINAVRTKNAIFNEILLKSNSGNNKKSPPKISKEKPYLKLVK